MEVSEKLLVLVKHHEAFSPKLIIYTNYKQSDENHFDEFTRGLTRLCGLKIEHATPDMK